MNDLKNEYPLLFAADTPDNLKRISPDLLPELAEETRSFLLQTVSENGGHLASNLGVVGLTIAIHRVFDCPRDHIIWDVGHQSYVHKLFTGRAAQFETLRKPGGISGFTRRKESECDCFGAGHSSTSLSAALGFAHADRICGSDAYTVAVIGDGAFTGGMIHEALNNCSKDLRLIIILNENEMSISKNIGRFARSLSKLRIKSGYFRTKKVTGKILKRIPLVGKGLFRIVRGAKVAVKNAIYGSNYFEDLGMYYLGPLDGNNENEVEQALREAKKLKETVIIHIKTQKGKGYAPAENSPSGYHGVPPHTAPKPVGNTFSEEMGEELTALAGKDPRICAVTAAMSDGTGLNPFRERFKDRFFDVGIAEEHAVTFCAGLAAGGMRPVFAVYSTFLQRAYDSVLHDAALQELPVVLCVDRAGLNASDGATHHGIFDVSFLSEIPGVTIYTPVTLAGLRLSLETALASSGVSAIRYSNGGELPEIRQAFYGENDPTTIGVRTDSITDSPDAVIVTHGRIAAEALRTKELLTADGIRVRIILCEFLKPYRELARQVAPLIPDSPGTVLFLEEEIRAGGFGMLLSDRLGAYPVMKNKSVLIAATDDQFVIPEKGETVYEAAGISATQIAAKIRKNIRKGVTKS